MTADPDILPWNDNFATGIESIDVQHRKLVGLINKLASQLTQGADVLDLTHVFDELTDYTVYHFQSEEAVWEKHLKGDTLTAAHQLRHQDFVAEVNRVRQQADKLSTDESVVELVSFLTHWLAFHILEDDTQLARIVLGLQRGHQLSQAKDEAARYMKDVAHVLIGVVIKMYDSLSSRTTALLREMSQRRRAEEKLRLSSKIIESSADGVFIINTHGLITDVNPAFCQRQQRAREALLGQPIAQVMPCLTGVVGGQNIWALADATGHWSGELSCRKPGGEMDLIWLSLSKVQDDALQTQHFVGMLSSICQLVERHHALEAAANHDTLTGLPNRRLLSDRLGQAIERSLRTGMLLAVCYLDLDRFKPINDQWGHAAGDWVLQVVAKRMKHVLRGADTVARVGGDEFVLLLGDLTSPAEAMQLLERLLQEVAMPIEVDAAEPLQVGASLGVALCPADASDANELLKMADQMLYLAKAQGKGCLRFYSAYSPGADA